MGYRIGQSSDFLVRGTASGPGIRFAFAETRQTVAAGILAHDTDPLAASFFGQALTVAALMGALLKDGEKYTLRWDYKGALRSILVDVNTEGHVRGIPRSPHLMAERNPDMKELFGDEGTITVIRSREGRVISSGSTRAAFLDISEDMGYFLSTSDQVESELAVRLDFNPSPSDPVRAASGFLVQAMPGCDLEQFDTVRKCLRQPAFRDTLSDSALAWESKLYRLLEKTLGPAYSAGNPKAVMGLRYEFGRAPSYTCSCSSERLKNALAMLEKGELEEIMRTQGKAEVVCEFCRRRYVLGPSDLPPASE